MTPRFARVPCPGVCGADRPASCRVPQLALKSAGWTLLISVWQTGLQFSLSSAHDEDDEMLALQGVSRAHSPAQDLDLATCAQLRVGPH